jgi:hypothetical protein
MSLDVMLVDENDCEVFWANITHNLNTMADGAGLYKPLWRPEEVYVQHARDLIEYLERGIQKLVQNPSHYSTFNAPNGWGTYDVFLPWCCRYLEACRKYPNSRVTISR